MGFGFEIFFIAEPFYTPGLNKLLGLCCATAGDDAEPLAGYPKRLSQMDAPTAEATPRGYPGMQMGCSASHSSAKVTDSV